MPIYQYHCRNCGADIEKMQSFTSEPLVECPECHQQTLKKIMSAAGIIFKGSGWYITDSKKSSSAVATSGEKGESKAGENGATANGESKSESKSGESKPAESKSGESKTGESKSSEAAAATPAPAASPTA